jgi:hypothetical protein
MPITFNVLVSTIASAWKGIAAVHSWATDLPLRRDFEVYLDKLESREVLYAKWEYENIVAVLNSLSEILDYTRDFKADHLNNSDVRRLFSPFIKTLQRETETIRGCDMRTTQGEFMAYKALLKIRSEMAQMLAVLCGLLDVDPRKTELSQFIMNMALVRPRSV